MFTFVLIRLSINILLLSLVLFQSTGLWMTHSWKLAQVRHEMKQRIKAGVPEEDLVLLKIPKVLEEKPNMVFKRIHAKEFRYKGEMYDIMRSVDKGDETWYTCIHDVKESGMFHELDALTKVAFNASDIGRNYQQWVLSFFGQHYLGFATSYLQSFYKEVKTLFIYKMPAGIVPVFELLKPPEVI